MNHLLDSYHFAVKTLPSEASIPRELARTMAPHSLSFQEFPYDPAYILYNNRLTPDKLDHATDDEMYWKIRRTVILRHTGELPIEITGSDAEVLLNRVFTRDVSKVKPNRCSYQNASDCDGGMITDGVLLRLGEDKFWMVQAEGDLFNWYKAHTDGRDVCVCDPQISVNQIQEPRSLDYLLSNFDQPEHSPMICLNPIEATQEQIVETADQPLPWTEVALRFPGRNDILPLGAVGEICARSYAVLIARAKGAQMAVVGLSGKKWRKIIAAFILSEAQLNVSDLKVYCRRHLSPQKTSTIWIEVSEFPLIGSGKVQKFAICDKFLADGYGERLDGD